MASLGWYGIFMSFHHCKNPKDATRILTDALRSDKPLTKQDREGLARLIEGSDNPLFESHCEIEIRRRRSRKREENQNAKYEALERVHELVKAGMKLDKATETVCDGISKMNLQPETLRKEYPSYLKAIFVEE
ncbi:MAG: hypothetical protein ABSC25_05505 [Roseiarcus sp.]